MYLSIFKQSLIYDEPPKESAEESKEAENEEKTENEKPSQKTEKTDFVRKILPKETNRILDKNVIKWIGYALTPEHSI